MMDHIFDETQPIYFQIVQRICARILRGELKPGNKLPSVIDAAMHFKVNHNTIQRVYQELTRQGIAVGKRGEGTFVTEDQNVLGLLHEEMRKSLLENFLTEMRRLGYSPEEIINTLQDYIQTEGFLTTEEQNL
jgi:DNA-binding transcriptional regulator YhcF (GntR family)